MGSENNQSLGELHTEVIIDNVAYPIMLHVIPNTLTRHGVIIGNDFLDTVEMRRIKGQVIISKLDDSEDKAEKPEVLGVDAIQQVGEVDLSHIKNAKDGEAVRECINSYKPCKVREVGISMNIIVKDEDPVHQRPRRLSPSEKAMVDEQIEQWIREGVIQPTYSEYASPIVLIRKKDGSIRICIDYRWVNKKILKERYPLPLIDDQFDSLQGARIFSTLDLRNGFFHVPVNEKSRKFTAFVVPGGHYEFKKMPFGLCNSPSVFQRFINAVFKELTASKTVLIYMDDLILSSDDIASGLEKLRLVLKTASEFGLEIKWKKCQFLQSKISYLGNIIENGRVRPSKDKTAAVVKFPEAKDVKAVRSFLGLSGYFRKFIQNYSIIARPLSDLLKDKVPFRFDYKERQAFERLKSLLSDKPVLRLYKTNAETELHTDACSLGIGAILMQKDSESGMFYPVYYVSGKTTTAEEKYCRYELEVLAIVKALQKFRVYLLGIDFKIITDCQAFALTIKKKDLCVRVAR